MQMGSSDLKPDRSRKTRVTTVGAGLGVALSGLAGLVGIATPAAGQVSVDYFVQDSAKSSDVIDFSTGDGIIVGLSVDNITSVNPLGTRTLSLHNDLDAPRSGGLRRIATEVDLGRIRAVSADPADVTSGVFEFYMDDILSPTRQGVNPVPSFKLELYADTADGVITGEPDIEGVNSDYDGGVLGTVDFVGASIEKPPVDQRFLDGIITDVADVGVTYTGTFGDTIQYPGDYTDPDFDGRGYLGFSIDVTPVLRSVLADSSNAWLGFRLLADQNDPAWTSFDAEVPFDPADPVSARPFQTFFPSLQVEVVPEPGVAALALGLGAMSLRRRRG
ncbi:MAG: hypothetical protein AAF663_02965 [Planctomycetota bacterium]